MSNNFVVKICPPNFIQGINFPGKGIFWRIKLLKHDPARHRNGDDGAHPRLERVLVHCELVLVVVERERAVRKAPGRAIEN